MTENIEDLITKDDLKIVLKKEDLNWEEREKLQSFYIKLFTNGAYKLVKNLIEETDYQGEIPRHIVLDEIEKVLSNDDVESYRLITLIEKVGPDDRRMVREKYADFFSRGEIDKLMKLEEYSNYPQDARMLYSAIKAHLKDVKKEVQ